MTHICRIVCYVTFLEHVQKLHKYWQNIYISINSMLVEMWKELRKSTITLVSILNYLRTIEMRTSETWIWKTKRVLTYLPMLSFRFNSRRNSHSKTQLPSQQILKFFIIVSWYFNVISTLKYPVRLLMHANFQCYPHYPDCWNVESEIMEKFYKGNNLLSRHSPHRDKKPVLVVSIA
jgi:hypothetical protein